MCFASVSYKRRVFGFHCFLFRTEHLALRATVESPRSQPSGFTEEEIICAHTLGSNSLDRKHHHLAFGPRTASQTECEQLSTMSGSRPVRQR